MLPQVKSESGITPETQEGLRVHAVVEKFIKQGRSTDGIDSEEDRKICARVAKTLGPIPLLGERSELGYLVRVGELPGEDAFNIHSSPEQPDGLLRRDWLYGIADYLGCHSENVYSIADFKTGSYFVQQPEWNWQLLLPAIGLWIGAGSPDNFSVNARIIKIRNDSVDADRCSCDDFTFDSGLLRERLGWLRHSLLKAKNQTPETVTLYEGRHCEYCPARARCPAKVGAIAQALRLYGYPPEEIMPDVVVRMATNLIECKPQLDKAAKELIKMNGRQETVEGKKQHVMDLGDGREAVVSVDGKGKTKLFTRKKKHSESDVGVEGVESDEV